MTKPTCKTCRFHVPALAGDFLECHRDTPPWSKVFKGSWCAQHEPEDPASGRDDKPEDLYDFKGYWRYGTPPTDGRQVLAIVDGEVTIVHRVRGYDDWLDALTGESCQPTNWMPLPPRPRKINDKPKP